MFVGHFGLALAAKRAAPHTSLGTLVLGAQFIDLLWPLLLLLGWERASVAPGIMRFTNLSFDHYPISHSLLAVAIWAVLVGGVYFVVRRYGRGSAILAALVVSHWLLDLIVHRPDLPLTPGGPARLGLGGWNSWIGPAVEAAIFVLGILIYTRSTRLGERRADWRLWSFVLFLLLIWMGALFGPPPASGTPVAISALAIWVLVVWAWFVDTRRLPALKLV